MVYQDSTNLYNIGKYIVDSTGTTPYSTIQSAMDAANATGGGTVYIRPGTYAESLTCYNNVNVQGLGNTTGNDLVIITGTHTPATTGTFSFSSIVFQPASTNDAFFSAAAGTADIILEYCVSRVDLAYLINVANWTGSVQFNYCTGGETATYRDSVYFCTSTGSLTIHGSSLGFGIGTAPMTVGGTPFVFPAQPANLITDSIIYCPVNFVGTALSTSGNTAWVNNVTFSNGTFGNIGTGIISPFVITAPGSGIIFNTTGTVNISNNLIGVFAPNQAITGTGTGFLILNGVDFPFDATILPGINVSYGGASYCGPIRTSNISFDRGVTQLSADGQLIIGDTGAVPKIATLTAGDGISVVNGAGSITISATGSGVGWNNVTGISQTMSVNQGYQANNAALVTLTLPATAAFGDIIQVVGYGAGGWLIAQNAGQTIHFSGQDSTTGVGGSLASTNRYDNVELVCNVANTDFSVIRSIGNITVV